jgi:hypothetical protein
VVPWQKTTRSNQNPARISLDLTRSHRIGEDLARSNEISPDPVRSCPSKRRDLEPQANVEREKRELRALDHAGEETVVSP